MDLTQLSTLASQAKNRSIKSLFSIPVQTELSFTESSRAQQFSLSSAGLYLDYSKQNINEDELTALLTLAEQKQLSAKIAAMFSGQHINNTEDRAVLHTVLRASDETRKKILGKQADEVIQTEEHMEKIVDDVRSGHLLSASGKRYTDVLAIGIGGSYYGIKVALSALHPFHCTGIRVHVIANVDGGAIQEKLSKLDVDTTLVVVISKTFSTQETLLNAQAIKSWMLTSPSDGAANNTIMAKQWFAVSTNIIKATAFGIDEKNILPMWDWVGGRFSLWSAVGLPLALAIGNENFSRLKAGAREMDEHFQVADFRKNMPVLLALIGIWNRNALEYSSLAILPYDHALRALPGYLQQTDMESNGKSVSNNGEKLPWSTAPVVFGQEGTNGQHAFMQLMHQSVDIIPTDFILALNGSSKYLEHHKVLVANCFAQSEALMQGKTLAQAKEELQLAGYSANEIDKLALHKEMKGNTPSNTILMETLTPKTLGSLLALYEHKIFVQGVIWQLNSFDQWGVELGKVMGNEVLAVMDGQSSEDLSCSTLNLIKRFQEQSTIVK